MRLSVRRWIVWYLVGAVFVIGITPRVYAGFSPSEIVGHSQVSDRHTDLEKIKNILEMKMVRERLKELGFTAGEIQNRLSQLSDPQIHQLALNLDDVKAGGDSGLGIIIALLVIAILVIVIIQLTGHKVIIK